MNGGGSKFVLDDEVPEHAEVDAKLADGDTVTVLRSRGRRLAKLIGADGTIENYDSARLFDLFSVPVGGLDDLHELLVQLAGPDLPDRHDHWGEEHLHLTCDQVGDGRPRPLVRNVLHLDPGQDHE